MILQELVRIMCASRLMQCLNCGKKTGGVEGLEKKIEAERRLGGWLLVVKKYSNV